jgi:chemotaxis methyl-accepting protein methylase
MQTKLINISRRKSDGVLLEKGFFVEPHRWQNFIEPMLMNILRSHIENDDRSFYFWNIGGGGSGQDSYSFVFLLNQCLINLGENPDNWTKHLLVSEQAEQRTASAKKGLYTFNHLAPASDDEKESPRAWLNKANPFHSLLIKYGDITEDSYTVKESIRNSIDFSTENVMDRISGSTKNPENFDVVFMNAVIHYFNLENLLKVLNFVQQSMKPIGLLCIDYAPTPTKGLLELQSLK